MLRRLFFAMLAGVAALAIAAPAANAAPSFSQGGYEPAGATDEWPDVPWTWLAGPQPAGVATAKVAPSSLSFSGLTADECGTVFADPDVSPMVKSMIRTALSPTQTRLRIQLDTVEAAGAFRLRDCIWVDDGDGIWEEPTETLFGIDLEPVVWVGDTTDNVGSFARFSVNLPIAETQAVCDRAARSDQLDDPPPSASPLLRSNTLCLPGSPDPVVPEAAVVALLPLTAAALGGGFWLLRRRRLAIA